MVATRSSANSGKGGFATSWLVYDQQVGQLKVLKEFHHGVPGRAARRVPRGDRLRHDRCGRGVRRPTRQGSPLPCLRVRRGGEPRGQGGRPRCRRAAHDRARTFSRRSTTSTARISSTATSHLPNVIVADDGSGNVKLIDFGLAVQTGDRPVGLSPVSRHPRSILANRAPRPATFSASRPRWCTQCSVVPRGISRQRSSSWIRRRLPRWRCGARTADCCFRPCCEASSSPAPIARVRPLTSHL